MNAVPPTVFNFSTSFERLGYNLTKPKTGKVAVRCHLPIFISTIPEKITSNTALIIRLVRVEVICPGASPSLTNNLF